MKILRTIIAILLLPLLVVCIYNFVKTILTFAGTTNLTMVPFWLGIIIYFIFQAVFFKPMRTYVFGHELTHALTGLLSGAKIKKFKVSKNSGSVSLTKDNIFITLSPYFIPIYSLFIIIVYLFLAWFIDVKPFYSYYLFLSGIAIAFHLALTFYAISIGQSDMKVYGVFFSLVVVCLINIVMLSIVLVLIFPHNISIGSLFAHISKDTLSIYKYLLFDIWH